MKKTILFLCSLCFVMAATAIDISFFNPEDPFYTANIGVINNEIEKVGYLGQKNEKYVSQTHSNLLQTEDGQVYDKISSDWYSCVETHGRKDTMCADLGKLREAALEKLQKTSEYPAYLSAITDRDYYAIKTRGLKKAADFSIHQKERFDSEKAAMIAGVESMIRHHGRKPSTSFLLAVNDLATIEKDVQEELYGFINKNIQ